MDQGGLWYVVFPAASAIQHAAWWQRLLPPGYRHVWACRAAGDGTLAINHAGRLLQVELVALPIGVFLADRQAAQRAWIMAVPAPTCPARPAMRLPMTCVETVKALLGIRALFVLTPRQLARHLWRLGAKPVLPTTSREQRPWQAGLPACSA